jgi:hypothetical protein
LRSFPGTAVFGVGASTVGENWLPPVGFRFFSVGVGAGAEVVVVVVVVDGLGVVLLEQPTASAPIATIAAPPTIAGTRRVKRSVFMVCPI